MCMPTFLFHGSAVSLGGKVGLPLWYSLEILISFWHICIFPFQLFSSPLRCTALFRISRCQNLYIITLNKESFSQLTQCSFEPHCDKTNEMACASSEDSDQAGHPASLIRVFAVCLIGRLGSQLSSSRQRRLWSDWADALVLFSVPAFEQTRVEIKICRLSHIISKTTF